MAKRGQKIDELYLDIGLNIAQLQLDFDTAGKTVSDSIARLNSKANNIHLKLDADLAKLDGVGTELDKIKVRHQAINRELDIQRQKEQILAAVLQAAKKNDGVDSASYRRAESNLLRQQRMVAQTEAEVRKLNHRLKESAVLSGTLGGRISAGMTAAQAGVKNLTSGFNVLSAKMAAVIAVAATGAGLFNITKDAMLAGENVYKLTQRLHVSAGEAATLNRVFQLADTDIKSIIPLIARLDKQVSAAGNSGNDTTRALSRFGIALKDQQGNLLPLNEQLAQLAKGYKTASEAGMEEAYTAEVLGARGAALIPILEQYDDLMTMSNLAEEGGLSAKDRTSIDGKRMVFIVDEAHRSTFGTMLAGIKATFPNAVFFGFTGTPIFEENAKKKSDQMDVFGARIHTYTIADGIRDGNVLGFDPYQVLTFRDRDVRRAVALHEAKAQTVAEALADPAKAKVYRHFTTDKKIRMAGYADANGIWVQGIEDYLPSEQYRTEEHTRTVVEDIGENWEMLSHAGKFHAIFATSSIAEAVRYYRRMKAELPKLAVTCLFDPNIDNNDGAAAKQDDLLEIISDYNARYAQNFTLPMHAAFKKDVALRLAHKEPYRYLAPEQQLDLLIVVDQMLTGFDSKWVNTLYLDKLLTYENIIQAFSRTNRLFGSEKPFGVIRYYRKPHTMQQNIEAAVRLYAENRPQGLFVDKLPYHLRRMNELYADIADLFAAAGVADFMQLPGDRAERGKFAALFRDFNSCLRAAEVQGFHWKKSVYKCEDGGAAQTITLSFDEQRYRTLALRYKELFAEVERTRTGGGDVPYDLVGDLMEIDTEVIDADYMNSRFEKYLKALEQGEGAQQAKDELHRTFAALGREEQKYAAVFLHDLESGNVTVEAGRTLRDYITQYQCHAKTTEIDRLADAFGLDGKMLKEISGLGLTAATINAYGRLDALKQTVDLQKAQAFLKDCDGRTLRVPDVHRRVDEVLRTFILNGALAPEIRTALL